MVLVEDQWGRERISGAGRGSVVQVEDQWGR